MSYDALSKYQLPFIFNIRYTPGLAVELPQVTIGPISVKNASAIGRTYSGGSSHF